MKDSLYLNVALWLTGRLNHTISERTQEPSYYPKDMQLDETSQRLLWNHFYANSKE